MVCDALLEGPRSWDLRLGRRRNLQGEIWLHPSSGSLVHKIAQSVGSEAARRSEEDARTEAAFSGLAARNRASATGSPGMAVPGCAWVRVSSLHPQPWGSTWTPALHGTQ